MKDEIFLSVIIPAYQAGDYIGKCLDSLRGITVRKEILIVVDSWEDSTLKALGGYLKESGDIRILLNDDKGMSEARNTGMRIARGRYIWFVDADDWICGAFNEMIWKNLEEYEPEILMFDAGVVNETAQQWNASNYIRKNKIKAGVIFSGAEFFETCYRKDAYRTPVWLNLFSRAYLERRQLFFLKDYAHEDEDYTFRALLPAKRVLYLDEIFYIRRYRDNSAMTSGFHEKQLHDFSRILQSNAKFIESYQTFSLASILVRYLYDRILVLIDRIRLSDSLRKEQWYQETALWFYGYMEEASRRIEDPALPMLTAEVFLHLRAVMEAFPFEKQEAEVQKKWRGGVREKIKGRLKNREGAYLGIYGTGNHTRLLFSVYEEIACETRRQLIFIDSSKVSHTEKLEGYDIINIRDSRPDMDIVVSSYFNQNEMRRMLEERNPSGNVITLYV